MPLNPTKLFNGILEDLESKPTTVYNAAEKAALRYEQYARDAMAGTARPILTGTERVRLQTPLFTAMSAMIAANPPSLAASWSLGLTAFWMTPPVQFLSPDGIFLGPVAIPGAPLVVSPLTLTFSRKNPTVVFATELSAALDAATRATIVSLLNTTTGVVIPTPLI
jgi:hypothetical protein